LNLAGQIVTKNHFFMTRLAVNWLIVKDIFKNKRKEISDRLSEIGLALDQAG
jgi:hypothetical protein